MTNAYLTLRADQELLQLAHDTLSTQKRTYALTQALFDAGNATQIDLRRAEIALRTAEVSQAAYTRVAAQDRNALVLLLGQPLTAELSASLDKANTLPDDIIPSALPAGLPAELLVRRPDVRAAEQQLRAANANIGAARAAFFPAISLTGSAGTASSSLDGLFEPGSAARSFVPQISLPIFRGGALRANLDLAQVQKRIEIANYEKAIQVAFREVADGTAGRQTRTINSVQNNCWCRPARLTMNWPHSASGPVLTIIWRSLTRNERCSVHSKLWFRPDWRE